jgi:translation initiation factor IF-3
MLTGRAGLGILSDENRPAGGILPAALHIRVFRRTAAIEPKTQRVNEQIRTSPVRVISAEGAQLGILPIDDALAAARQANLDLVEVAPNERPPVCRIMDFGKFKYQQKKRQHRTHSHQVRIKEIRVRPKTGEHDVNVKATRAREFLTHKNKVLVSVMFRGREMAHVEEGRRVLDEIIAQLEDIARVEATPSQQGRRIVCTLAPK